MDIVYFNRDSVKSIGLNQFFNKVDVKDIVRYKSIFRGIVVQEVGGRDLYLVKPGDKIVLLNNQIEYCRHHNTPLNQKDDPLKRNYCVKPADTKLGFCNQHRESMRAYYSLCFESFSIDNINYCQMLDELSHYSIEYSIYLLSYGVDGFKVGSTRSFRLLERIAEQPHVLATWIYSFNSAVKAREIESKIGRIEGLHEIPRREFKKVLNTPVNSVVYRFDKFKEKIEKAIGLNILENPLIRIESTIESTLYLKAIETSVDQVLDKILEVVDFYQGYLLLSDIRSNTYYVVKASKLLNRDVLKTIQ